MAEHVSRYFNKIECTGILIPVNEISSSINTLDAGDRADKKGAAYWVMKALGNTGIILDILILRIVFSETLLAGEALTQYSDPFTIPMPAIAAVPDGISLCRGLSLAVVFFVWHARDVPDVS